MKSCFRCAPPTTRCSSWRSVVSWRRSMVRSWPRPASSRRDSRWRTWARPSYRQPRGLVTRFAAPASFTSPSGPTCRMATSRGLQAKPSPSHCASCTVTSTGSPTWRGIGPSTNNSTTRIRALDRQTYGPLLGVSDRRLLRQALESALDKMRNATRAVIHGSPHRMNILSMRGAPVFIDLETIQLGPIEWDLAHLEPAVADQYPGPYDEDLLATCRTAVSAATATWCWGALERGPDMRTHAEHHLAVVRATS